MSEDRQDVVVIQQRYGTNKDGFEPVLYEIEVDGEDLIGITEEAAKVIYQELGKFLFPEKGGES
ncbi:hypothetical protein FACS189451_08770 [Bacteroidia bacterium]|nr:hypothetical protein FACS189451_08770 [Bacteroidia bacterium]